MIVSKRARPQKRHFGSVAKRDLHDFLVIRRNNYPINSPYSKRVLD